MVNKLYEYARLIGIEVLDCDLPTDKLKGLCWDNVIYLDHSINTNSERKCILAEEIAHYELNSGNILDQKVISNKKQEIKARRKAVDMLVSLEDLINCYKKGLRNKYEICEELEITEEFLTETLDYFACKYGTYKTLGDYCIVFNPLTIIKKEK